MQALCLHFDATLYSPLLLRQDLEHLCSQYHLSPPKKKTILIITIMYFLDIPPRPSRYFGNFVVVTFLMNALKEKHKQALPVFV